MRKKLILLDLDGTIIDHKSNAIPQSTIQTIKKLQEKGHIVVIATGRAPSLFYGVDKKLNIDTYVASNGRLIQHKDKILYYDPIDSEVVRRFSDDMNRLGLDVGYESKDDYAVSQKLTDFPDLFSDHFHLESPKVLKDFHRKNAILQMILFTNHVDLDYLRNKYEELEFNVSCQYGIDVNLKGGMKDIGIDILSSFFGIPIEDTIAVGDGYNDISMIQKAHFGVAMGNARDALKTVADFITDDCDKEGIEKLFKFLNLI